MLPQHKSQPGNQEQSNTDKNPDCPFCFSAKNKINRCPQQNQKQGIQNEMVRGIVTDMIGIALRFHRIVNWLHPIKIINSGNNSEILLA